MTSNENLDAMTFPLDPNAVFMLTGAWPEEIEEGMKDVEVKAGPVWPLKGEEEADCGEGE